MRKKVIYATLALIAAAPALADHPPVAHQGGRLAEAHGHRMELITTGSSFEVLLKDEHDRPMPAQGFGGKAIVLAPSGKAEVPLRPDGDKLTGPLPAGAELAAAVVSLRAGDGHVMNARFRALPPATAPSPALAAKGRAVYEAQCASCHGARLEGQDGWRTQPAAGAAKLAPPLDATGHGWQHDDEQLANTIRKGAAPMPPFAGVLSEQDIQAVIAYFKSSWPAATLAQQPKPPAAESPVRPAASGGSGHHAGH